MGGGDGGLVMRVGVGRGMKCERLHVKMGKSHGQWVISASSRFSKAWGGQPGGGSPMAP